MFGRVISGVAYSLISANIVFNIKDYYKQQNQPSNKEYENQPDKEPYVFKQMKIVEKQISGTDKLNFDVRVRKVSSSEYSNAFLCQHIFLPPIILIENLHNFSELELYGALCHEYAHYSLKHSMKHWMFKWGSHAGICGGESAILWRVGIKSLLSPWCAAGISSLEIIRQYILPFALLSYKRYHEKEADLFAAQYGGKNAAIGMISFFKKGIETAQRNNKTNNTPSYKKDHPSDEERIEYLRKYA